MKVHAVGTFPIPEEVTFKWNYKEKELGTRKVRETKEQHV